MKNIHIQGLFGSILLMMLLMAAVSPSALSQVNDKKVAAPEVGKFFRTEYLDSLISSMELIPMRVTGDKNNRIKSVEMWLSRKWFQ